MKNRVRARPLRCTLVLAVVLAASWWGGVPSALAADGCDVVVTYSGASATSAGTLAGATDLIAVAVAPPTSRGQSISWHSTDPDYVSCLTTGREKGTGYAVGEWSEGGNAYNLSGLHSSQPGNYLDDVTITFRHRPAGDPCDKPTMHYQRLADGTRSESGSTPSNVDIGDQVQATPTQLVNTYTGDMTVIMCSGSGTDSDGASWTATLLPDGNMQHETAPGARISTWDFWATQDLSISAPSFDPAPPAPAINVGRAADLTYQGSSGNLLTVYARTAPDDELFQVGRGTVDSNGQITFSAAPRVNTAYWAQTLGGSTPLRKVNVRPAMSLKGSGSGTHAAFTGVVVPGRAGIAVRLFSIVSGRLHLAGTAVTDSRGHWSYARSFSAHGKVAFLAQSISDPVNIAGQSNRTSVSFA